MSYVGEALAAAHVLALMRLLAGVSADVDSQGASLDEALATARNRARVGTLVGVDSVMALKIRLAVEALLGEELLALGRALSRQASMEELTLLHESQSHWKGRVAGSYSTSSRSSIVSDEGEADDE